MAFRVEHTPISAALSLATIAGRGRGMVDQQARELQAQQMAYQLAAQQAQQQNAINAAQLQAQNEAAAQQESGRIQQAIATAELEQKAQADQLQFQQQQARDTAQREMAQREQSQNQQQFQQRQAVDERRQSLNEKEFETKQAETVTQKKAVYDLIDQIAPPNTPENLQMRLQYEATGRLPAPAGNYPARNLNALIAYRRTLVDPIGEALPGKEQELAAIDKQLSGLAGGIGGAAPEASAPITAINPSTGQRIRFDEVSGQWVPIQ